MRGDDIAERLLDFGASAIRLCTRLPSDPAVRHIASQLARSSSSGGANYDEARRAESLRDFAHKAQVAAKELGESVYWLKLVSRTQLVEFGVDELINEANELTAILVSSAKTAKKNLAKR